MPKKIGRPVETNSEVRRRIFDFVVRYKRGHDGNSPSSREIMDGVGISSTSVVHYLLDELAREGKIRRSGFKSRQIEVVGGDWQFHEEFTERAIDNR